MPKAKNKYTLHEMRVLSGKTGSIVSEICGVTYQSLRNWETGITTPNIVNVQDLLQIYGFKYNQLDLEMYYENATAQKKKKSKIVKQMDNPIRDRLMYENKA